MNKLFTKIATAFAGMAMVVGVGVAVASSEKEATPVHASAAWVAHTGAITAGNEYLIVKVSGDKCMQPANSTASGTTTTSAGSYSQVSFTAASGPDRGFIFADAGSGKFYIKDGTTFVRANGTTNNGLCSAANNNTNPNYGIWTVTETSTSGQYTIINANSRQLSAYSTSNWRSYATTTTSSITNVKLYEKSASYTISYNNNGGSGTMTSTTGSNPAVASCTFIAPTGKHFDHWNTSATDNGTTYAVGATPKATITLYAIWATNSYTVGGTITNGSLSSTANVSHGSALNITINPSSGHKLPTALTSVTMGGSAYAGYTYNSGTGAFSIASVTGNVVINATCPIDATTYTISGTITNGFLTGDTGEQVEGDDYVVQISPSALYKYPTSVTVTGAGEEDSGWEYDSSYGIVYIYGLGGNVTISATCPAASITSITVSGQKTAFTLGEDFSFGGTVKASYDDVAGTTGQTISIDLVNIDDSAYDAFTESNSYTISVALKSNSSVSTLYTVSVTRKSISTTTTYNPVTASKTDWSGDYVFIGGDKAYVMGNTVSSATRVENGSTLPTFTGGNITAGYTDYVYRIVKVTGGYTIQNVSNSKYLVGNGTDKQATLVSDISSNDYAVWSISYSSGFVITCNGSSGDYITLRNNTTYGWAIYKATTANAPQLYEKVETPSEVRSLIRLTATGPAANVKTEDDEVSASDFVATALFDTAESTTVTPTVVSVNGGSASSHLVEGSNTVVLSFTDPNNGSNIKTCEVTVIAAEQTAELDGITWDKAGISILQFEGSTIVYGSLHKHFDNGTTVALDITECTVAVYSNNSGTKAHDIASPTSYTLSLENDNGKYLGVTYSGYTLYSGQITVVELLNPIYGKVETNVFTDKASNTNPIAVGDTVVFAYDVDETHMEMTSITSGSYGVVESFTSNPIGTYALTVEEGSSSGSFAFKNGSDYVAYDKDEGTTKNNNLWTQTTLDDKASWTVEYEGDNNDVVILTNVHNTERSLRFNTNSAQERIAGYLGSSFPGIQVYKGHSEWVPSGENIANTNAVVQKAVLEFAVHFNETMNCVQAGSTANVSGKWSTLSGNFDDALEAFSGDNLIHFKALFAGADAVEEGDTLQDMLARYQYICHKYQLEDFLADVGRPPVGKAISVNPLSLLTNNSGTEVAIIVVTSMIGLSAVGGFFFLRKRKENI